MQPQSERVLDAVGALLRSRPDIRRLTVEGHTCTDGPLSWNQQLSRDRAAVVRDYLERRCGVPRSRLEMAGHGPSKPLDESYCNRRRNRRVEFLVI